MFQSSLNWSPHSSCYLDFWFRFQPHFSSASPLCPMWSLPSSLTYLLLILSVQVSQSSLFSLYIYAVDSWSSSEVNQIRLCLSFSLSLSLCLPSSLEDLAVLLRLPYSFFIILKSGLVLVITITLRTGYSLSSSSHCCCCCSSPLCVFFPMYS